jgi:hypothetical protein
VPCPNGVAPFKFIKPPRLRQECVLIFRCCQRLLLAPRQTCLRNRNPTDSIHRGPIWKWRCQGLAFCSDLNVQHGVTCRHCSWQCWRLLCSLGDCTISSPCTVRRPLSIVDRRPSFFRRENARFPARRCMGLCSRDDSLPGSCAASSEIQLRRSRPTHTLRYRIGTWEVPIRNRAPMQNGSASLSLAIRAAHPPLFDRHLTALECSDTSARLLYLPR